MNLFSWNYFIAALFAILLYRFIPRYWGVQFLAFVSMAWVVFQQAPHPIIGLVFGLITCALLLFGWLFSRWIDKPAEASSRKNRLILGIVIVATPLAFSRLLLGFFSSNRLLIQVTETFGNDVGSLIAPLGISYFTFRIICYLVEIYRKNSAPLKPSEYLAYVTFFPTMLAGPIERVGTFVKQLQENVKADQGDVAEGIWRILQGLVKKILLAGLFYRLASPMLNLSPIELGFDTQLSILAPWQLWSCTLAYYFYIYFDFAGYSDIAIGTARLMGFRIMENFNWPILATNVSDFWQRWHISLTGWIRDYIYFPLGGNRKGLVKAAPFTLIAMFVVGVWHGAAVHFALWGIYHGTLLILYRTYRKWRRDRFPDKAPTKIGKFAGWLLTFFTVGMGWILFNFSTTHTFKIVAKMIGLG